MALSRPLSDDPLPVASNSKQKFCRFCGKEAIDRSYIDLQTNEKYYALTVNKLEYMNIKPAKKSNMNICKPCYCSFNVAYNFCQKFNRTQLKLANIEPSEAENAGKNTVRGTLKRVSDIKTELESSDEIDIEKVELSPPCSKRKKQIADSNKSWRSYIWTCCHCDEENKKLSVLRSHSKNKHGICFAFECPDCDLMLNDYVSFIEHIRNHKENLRFYCDVCDKPIEEERHHNHESGRFMCHFCGEILPDASSRRIHQKTYKKRRVTDYRKGGNESYIITVPDLQIGVVSPGCDVFQSWTDYVWLCSMCEFKFHSAQALRRHGVTVHDICCSMKCLDCEATADSFHKFILHIMQHRPSLRHFCPFCDRLAHSDELFRAHIREHLTNSSYCPECGQIYPNTIAPPSRGDRIISIFWFLEPAGRYAYDKPLIETSQTTLVEEAVEESVEDDDNDEEKEKEESEEEEDTSDEGVGCNYNDKKSNPVDYSLPCPTSCASCKETFTDKRLYREHTNTDYCPICDETFNCTAFKKTHLFSVHMAEKPYECYKCGRCHRSRERAYQCMESHLSAETRMCNICRSMVLTSFIKEHVEAHNYDDGPFEKVCGFGYCTVTFASWMERVNHRHSKHLAMTYRKVRSCRRYLTQRNILGLLPITEKLRI